MGSVSLPALDRDGARSGDPPNNVELRCAIRGRLIHTRADFDRLEGLAGWAKARSCAPCGRTPDPPGQGGEGRGGAWWTRFALLTLRRFDVAGTRSRSRDPCFSTRICVGVYTALALVATIGAAAAQDTRPRLHTNEA